MAAWKKSKTFLTRTITASFLVPVTLLFMWLGGIFLLFFVLAIINISLIEFLRFCHRRNIYPYPACIFLPANLIPVCVQFSLSIIHLWAAALFFIILLSLLRFSHGNFLERISTTLLAIVYLSLLPTCIILLRWVGFKFCLFPLILTWVFDTGAYLIGVAVGRHKLAPSISPKKTYEGLIGGLIVTLPATFLLNHWLATKFALYDIVLMTVGIAILATLGDLFESAFKRDTDLKDTSTIFPGHGGMLDRIDSLLFTIPFFYLLLRLRGF